MIVERTVCFLLFCEFLRIVNGISNNNEGNLIDEEFHRAADTPKDIDDTKIETLKRDLLFTGHNLKYQHPSYDGAAYAPVGPDNLGYTHGQIPLHNIRSHHGYGAAVPSYGHLYNGGGALNYGHSGLAYGQSGGGSGLYGHSGGVGSYGHSGGGTGLYGHTGGLGSYGHSGGGGGGDIFPYGHSGSGVTYGHSGEGHSYDHGYGISGIGHYLQKKLSLKKLFLPLAGLALIAALTKIKPIVLQLDTSTSKRSLEEHKDVFPINPFIKPKNN